MKNQNTPSPQSDRTEPLSSSSERSLSQEIENDDNPSPTKTLIISPTGSVRLHSSSPDKLENKVDVSINLLNRFKESCDDETFEDQKQCQNFRQLATIPEDDECDSELTDKSMERKIEQSRQLAAFLEDDECDSELTDKSMKQKIEQSRQIAAFLDDTECDSELMDTSMEQQIDQRIAQPIEPMEKKEPIELYDIQHINQPSYKSDVRYQSLNDVKVIMELDNNRMILDIVDHQVREMSPSVTMMEVDTPPPTPMQIDSPRLREQSYYLLYITSYQDSIATIYVATTNCITAACIDFEYVTIKDTITLECDVITTYDTADKDCITTAENGTIAIEDRATTTI
ncbi:hypothetical protein RFI_12686 [Reticulomyxa filosa]|uniref:Uncharacterized protein n=1 Tax=Reticulomyxa filosa TaxID=46433 RepID=X6NDS4_RETFI|nr:hypothetical protein RFI_12686 [Reticulomyxa filosa]|eukprot:ETO24470.1 hypothetical protein RFI_12686 [Reticulomyxa filosa]